RNYEGYASQNIFFLRGHLLTGGDSPVPFIASFILLLGIAGTWFGTTCVWWWKDESPAVAAVGAYMCLVTISSMLATALRDPGILPRGLDQDPPYPAESPSDGSPPQPFPRDLRIGDSVVRVKYCITCKTYRPPRSSHCKSCDNCVDGCDHHCQWVNNCVGRRNYTSFITFLVAASLTLALVIVTAALHLFILTRRNHISFRTALSTAPGSAVVFSLGIVVIWPLLALMGYHVRLLLLNITTIEQVRNKVHATLIPGPAPPNPFSLGRWHRNVAYLLCRPAGYSWIDASAVKMEDRRLINPGAYE
ncbi:zf-DHHC-domain-containing protein, partial [Ramaria rubella]